MFEPSLHAPAAAAAHPSPGTLVVDATYRCNSPCRYCRWGSPSTAGREDMPLAELCLPLALLEDLETTRVVICGGEPMLYPHLESLVRHYAKLCPQVVIVTNGLVLDERSLERLHAAGLTGAVVSVDSADPQVFRANRGLDESAHRRVLDAVAKAARWRRGTGFELGINAVVTRVSGTVASVAELMAFAEQHEVDVVKFAPVFDDGFAGVMAPDLMLVPNCAPELEAIAKLDFPPSGPSTNPPSFWRDIARLARGETFDGAVCGLDGRTALLARGRLSLCYWVPESEIRMRRRRGRLQLVAQRSVADARRDLAKRKPGCRVGSSCWCMQRLDHDWSGRSFTSVEAPV
ncbi:MAG: radical SAM protein [Myxococcales bacterium]|nr:radical SAM protein [Myxococcales bacterium]